MMKHVLAFAFLCSALLVAAPEWEKDNPVVPLPTPPLGIQDKLTDLKEPPTPERVRLGRWLFYDKRISKDNTVSCATCHRPEFAFTEPTPNSAGVGGARGNRKAPTFINLAWTFFPHFFWDGRASSLEDQALGPVANPIEMGSTHEAMVGTITKITGYKTYFKQAFGTEEVTKEKIAKAIADYERTRMSGNSPWDKWKAGDELAVKEDVKKGDELFFGKAQCNQCHFGQNFTDNRFHNLGLGWNKKTKKFADDGRFIVSKAPEDKGAFKTPTVRDAQLRAPFMHDGSMKTLEEVVQHYNKGGNKNPQLSPKIHPLKLSKAEVGFLVKFLEALSGEGYQDTAPKSYPM